MITITFDEKGSFENIHSEQEHVFIAGFLNDDRGIQNETSNERERIKRYYKAVCQTAGTIYPVDLHVDHGNSTSVAKTKQTVRKTLGSFLKDGVFIDPENPGAVNRLGMDERKGKYYLFAKVPICTALVNNANNGIINSFWKGNT